MILKNIMVFFSLTIATSIYTNLDNVMLGFMKGEVEVGYYGAAVKIKMLLLGLVTSASAVLLPRASYYVDKGMKDELFDILQKTLHFVIMITLPFTIYFITFAEECILLLAGESYRQSITSMQVIMPTIIFIGITNIIGIQMMVPLGKEKLVFLISDTKRNHYRQGIYGDLPQGERVAGAGEGNKTEAAGVKAVRG